jgi:hypothetical protein
MMNIPKRPAPADTDLHVNFLSQDWTRTKEWLLRELLSARKELETENTSERAADRLRGRIAFVKKMVSQEKYAGAPKVPHEADYDY